MAFTKAAPKKKYEHKENRGTIFDNDRKETEQHPDFTGSANIGGVLFWVNGWAESTRTGARKLSLSFKRQDEQAPSESRPTAASQNRPAFAPTRPPEAQAGTVRRGW